MYTHKYTNAHAHTPLWRRLPTQQTFCLPTVKQTCSFLASPPVIPSPLISQVPTGKGQFQSLCSCHFVWHPQTLRFLLDLECFCWVELRVSGLKARVLRKSVVVSGERLAGRQRTHLFSSVYCSRDRKTGSRGRPSSCPNGVKGKKTLCPLS